MRYVKSAVCTGFNFWPVAEPKQNGLSSWLLFNFQICDEEPDTFEAMEMDSEEIEINSTDWENEEAKYENGHFTCLWEIDRNGTTPGHICGTTFNRRSDFVDHSKHHLNHSDRFIYFNICTKI